MRIIIIRHGAPDYEHDNLTDIGKKEAEQLTLRLQKTNIDDIYCSTMGRAIATITPTAKAKNLDITFCDWLREFDEPVKLPYMEVQKGCCWDLLPRFVEENPDLYNPYLWQTVDFLKNSNVPKKFNYVCDNFDNVLKSHGYERKNLTYKVHTESHETLVFACHYGLSSVLVSHLLNCSPYSLWQNAVMCSSSVAVFNSEEREKGIASFRMEAYGDTSHLYAADMPTSFWGKFCECYSDDTRHE